MLIKSIRASVILFVVALTVCADVSAASMPADTADTSMAYVYGNFLIPMRNVANIELQIESVPAGQKHKIKFRKDGGLAIAKIPPGKYMITGFVALSVIGQVQRTKDLLDAPFNVEFEVAAGRAYYLGNLVGECGTAYGAGMLRAAKASATATCWDVTPAADTFITTQQTLGQQYPEMRDMPTARAFQ